MAIIDTHNHLYFPGFKAEFENHLAQAKDAGVTKQILIGIDELSCQAALNLAQQHETFKVSLGLHPCDVDQLGQYQAEHHQYVGLNDNVRPNIKDSNDYFTWLDTLATLNTNTVAAFGETGFDQFHRKSESLLKLQVECFEAHLNLCQKHKKTLIIHSRGACAQTLNFFNTHAQAFKSIKFVWHCFTEGHEAAKAVINLGGYLGCGGVLTYPKSEKLRAIIKTMPLEHLLTETDAPFLTPHQARKKHKLNSPAFLPEVINTIASLKSISVVEAESKLEKNAYKAFGL